LRIPTFPKDALRRALVLKSGLIALALAALAPAQTENAVANGDTRTISLFHSHTKESISATFRVNGSYDYATLEKLNWFLRDWRRDEPTKMDPRLFDAIWETYRETGSQQPIVIVSAYRSPETNAMLRRRSRAVAEFSQHMLGKAMDMHYQDVPMSRVREIAMRLQRGGVGYYPTAGSPFVHMDVGSVRAWPRMSYDQLARLFPDGKTVHLPSNGQPLARYEEARAEVEARNGVAIPTVAQVQSKGFFASLFGGGEDDAGGGGPPAAVRGGPRVGGDSRVAGFIDRTRGSNASTRLPASRGGPTVVASAAPSAIDDNSAASFFVAEANRRQQPAVAAAQRNLPRGETFMSPPPAPVVVASAKPAPEPVEAKPVDTKVATAPIPPRRPTELALNIPPAFDPPLPTPRPSALQTATVEVRPARGAELPSVITTGGAAPVAASAASGLLAYAPAMPSATDLARPVPRPAALAKATAPVGAQTIGLRALLTGLRATDEAAARIDRSNFRLLTAPVEVAQANPIAMAPMVAGLRKASRNDLSGLVFAAPSGLDTRFETSGSLAPGGAFSGPAVRPLPRPERASLSSEAAPSRVN
jgi:uncharacterized protein YcbK (DUF882 family)